MMESLKETICYLLFIVCGSALILLIAATIHAGIQQRQQLEQLERDARQLADFYERQLDELERALDKTFEEHE